MKKHYLDAEDAHGKLIDIVTSEKEIAKSHKQLHLGKYDNQDLIAELYDRGVTVRDVFGRYYEIEAARDAKTMNVEDAKLTFAPEGEEKNL